MEENNEIKEKCHFCDNTFLLKEGSDRWNNNFCRCSLCGRYDFYETKDTIEHCLLFSSINQENLNANYDNLFLGLKYLEEDLNSLLLNKNKTFVKNYFKIYKESYFLFIQKANEKLISDFCLEKSEFEKNKKEIAKFLFRLLFFNDNINELYIANNEFSFRKNLFLNKGMTLCCKKSEFEKILKLIRRISFNFPEDFLFLFNVKHLEIFFNENSSNVIPVIMDFLLEIKNFKFDGFAGHLEIKKNIDFFNKFFS